MFEEAIKSLVASGPMAVVLGAAVVMLWRRVSKLTEQVEQAAATYASKLEQRQAEAQTREDNMRKHFEEQVQRERDENKTLWRETNTTLRGLIEGAE